jgi:hypothetical protein
VMHYKVAHATGILRYSGSFGSQRDIIRGELPSISLPSIHVSACGLKGAIQYACAEGATDRSTRRSPRGLPFQ